MKPAVAAPASGSIATSLARDPDVADTGGGFVAMRSHRVDTFASRRTARRALAIRVLHDRRLSLAVSRLLRKPAARLDIVSRTAEKLRPAAAAIPARRAR